MFWSLIMIVTINGMDEEYVLEREMTQGECYVELAKTPKYFHSREGVRVAVTYSCERR
jgi:hypothetical protein